MILKNIMEDNVCWIDTKEINLSQFLEEKDGKDLKKNFEVLAQNLVEIIELSEQLKNCIDYYNICIKYNNFESSSPLLTIATAVVSAIFIRFRHFLFINKKSSKDSYNLYYGVIKIILDNEEELLKKIESKESELERELSEFNKKNLEGNDAFIKREEKISYMDDLFSFKLGFTSLVNSLKKFKVDYITTNNKKNEIYLKKGTCLFDMKNLADVKIAHLLDPDKIKEKEIEKKDLIVSQFSVIKFYNKNIKECLDIFKRLFKDLYKGISNTYFNTENKDNLDTIFFDNAKIGLIYKNEILEKYFKNLMGYRINKEQENNTTTLTEYKKGRMDMLEEIYDVLMDEKTYNKLM